MLGPVTCGACGAKVREDRVIGLRCGAALGAPPAPPSQTSTRAIVVVAGVLALGALTTVIAGRPAAAVVTEVAATAPSATADAAAVASGMRVSFGVAAGLVAVALGLAWRARTAARA